MNDQPIKIISKTQKSQKILGLQSLQLKQLDQVCGGSDPEWKYVNVRR
jgi:hypothetical protein